MEMIKAIELLNAPPEIRFNLLAQERWLKSRDRKVRLFALLEFASIQTRKRGKELAYALNRMKISNELAHKATESLNKAVIHPNLNGVVDQKKAREAITQAYVAGYAMAVKELYGQSNNEAEEFATKGKALNMVSNEILKIAKFVADNQLVDGKGNIMVDSEGNPL